jgi:transketolase
METAECWAAALAEVKTPSVMCLSRQGLPALPDRAELSANLSAKGAYVVYEPNAKRAVTLLATGSEVQLAVAAAKALEGEGIAAAAVSMPSWELFRRQPAEYRKAVLGDTPRVAVEAGIPFGWAEWLGHDGIFIGMAGFGASGPAEALFKHFGITTEAVIDAARRAVRG